MRPDGTKTRSTSSRRPPSAATSRPRRSSASGSSSAIAGMTLNADPAVRSYPEFTEDAVCEWLIERARGDLRRALVYDAAHGRDIADHMRTNTAAGFDLMTADLVQDALQHRMAASVGLPI